MITLRPITDDDLPTIFEHQREPEGNAMAAFAARDWEAFLEHWRKKILADANVAQRAIIANGKLVGHVVSWKRDGKAMIGYWLGKAHWGKGYASQAVKEFLTIATPRPMYADVSAENPGSLRVLAKCGFKECGRTPIEFAGKKLDLVTLVLEA